MFCTFLINLPLLFSAAPQSSGVCPRFPVTSLSACPLLLQPLMNNQIITIHEQKKCNLLYQVKKG